MPRPGFLLLLVAAAAAVLAPAPLAGDPGLCLPIKGVVQAQLQASPGVWTLQGTVEGTLGGAPFVGGSLSVLSTPIEGVSGVDNAVPTEGGSETEVFDPARRVTTTDSGVLVPTPQKDVFLVVVHGQVTGVGSGQIHYQGTVDLEAGTATSEISGAVCL